MTNGPLPHDALPIRVERLLPAPMADVYAAWTDPDEMAQWLSPNGHAEVEADVRVGGAFRVTMIEGDFRLEHTGEYLVVDPPRRLSFTWRSAYTSPDASQVDVVLSARGTKTLLVLSHQRLPDATRASHEGGWVAILERLDALLGRHVTSARTEAQ